MYRVDRVFALEDVDAPLLLRGRFAGLGRLVVLEDRVRAGDRVCFFG